MVVEILFYLLMQLTQKRLDVEANAWHVQKREACKFWKQSVTWSYLQAKKRKKRS